MHLSNFAFTPDNLRFQVGHPVTLHLVNDSTGGHNFSAPALFAASSFPAGTSAPPNGTVEVGGNQSRDITFTPLRTGTYPFECTHFLHSAFGMTGSAEVVP